MIVIDCQQGSQEWHEARLGVVTASRVAKLITPARLQLSSQRETYMAELLHEWVTGTSAEEFRGNRWTEHGHRVEDDARTYFEDMTELRATAQGFVYRDDSRAAGCSPDWLNEQEQWGLELKCPAGWTHARWLARNGEAKTVPSEHVPQVQFSLWVTGYSQWWFMSHAAAEETLPWRPGASYPPHLVQCYPEPRWQDAFDEHVPAFLAELAEAKEQLLALGAHPFEPA